jgi:PAS domain S-box-containing protein
VQELLKIQGGTVRVDSEEGRGTAFTISLPFGTAHLPPDRVRMGGAGASTGVRAQAYVDEALRWLPDPATASGETGIDDIVSSHVPTAGVRPRVLLADDNADMRSYVSRLLAAECVVEAVGDGEAALRAIEADPPDLILTDIMMPRLDGFALLRAIRANAALRDIPVIVLSARAGEEASVEGLDAGADDYLVKPFSAGELRARVRANLSLARLRREATRSLVASEARLKAIFETVPVGIVIGEAPSGRIVEANRQAAAIFGHEIIYSPDVARYVEWPCFHADGRRVAAHEYPLARALAGEERPELEVRYRRGDGREAWVRYIAAPIRADGRITGGIVASVDIDREKRAIEALDRIREELEARVDEAVREREAAQASLAHAQRMEALGQLAGGTTSTTCCRRWPAAWR